MGLGSVWHWLILAVVVILLFGKGRISDVMGDVGRGIKSFKKGLSEEPDTPAQPSPRLEAGTQADVHADSKDKVQG